MEASFDPLAEFRGRGQTAPAPRTGREQEPRERTVAPPDDSAEYVAHRGADRQRFLTVYGRLMTRCPMNAGLKDVIDARGHGTYLCLLYADNFAIVLKGRNLLPARRAAGQQSGRMDTGVRPRPLAAAQGQKRPAH